MVKNKEGYSLGFLLFVVFVAVYATAIIMGIALTESKNDNDLKISQKTGDDFCKEVTGNKSSVAKDWWDYNSGEEPVEKGGLVCELPSYDSTHNIVIKKNNE